MTRDDFYDSPFGAAYSAYMERPRLSQAIARLVWGADVRPYYESMTAVGGLPEEGTVVDCPCGAGPALRAIPAGRSIRYIGVDLSPSMLRRADERADRRRLADVEFLEADAADLPLPDRCADLYLSYWGLHCFEDPAAALAEAARLLKPAGRLVGSCFVRGDDTLRQRLLLRPGRGDFGPIGTRLEVEGWLEGSGFMDLAIRRSGPMLFFEAHSSR